jgi:capsular polysaccharide export protein
MNNRRFLFLQGVCSPFFSRLADKLSADGHQVFKVNFNAGDSVFWGRRPNWNYRGSIADLHDFLDGKYRQYGITDQVLFGDRRPIHRPAIEHADVLGIRNHVFEEGYFRPFWITMEREGVNGHSLLPRDPDWFREVGATIREYGDGEPFPGSFSLRAAYDVAYHLAGVVNPFLFPRYKTHAQVSAPIEYLGYMNRLPRLRFHSQKDNALIDALIRSATPFYVLPLQLGSDAQIRDHSRFNDMLEVIEFVMRSFALHGPMNAQLVIKNHPLDIGLINYPKIINEYVHRFELSGRVHFIETGNLTTLLSNAQGTITVNSTTGSESLRLNCPTMSLSDPIYNLPGLTFQGELDDFWLDRQTPDRVLFRRFRNTVIHTTQINGGFYCGKGIELAVNNSARMLKLQRTHLEELL